MGTVCKTSMESLDGGLVMKKRRRRVLLCRVINGVITYLRTPEPQEKLPYVSIFGKLVRIQNTELPCYHGMKIHWI